MKFVPTRRDSFFDNMLDVLDTPVFGTSTMMRTDIHEKDGHYIFDVDLPGFKKEDIKISLYNGNLTISGSQSQSQEEKDEKGNLVRQERYVGQCSRSFYVGEGVKEEDIKAKFENGTLQITVPTEAKKEEETTKLINIE